MTLSYMSSADVYLASNCVGASEFQENSTNKKRKSGISQLLGTAVTATAVILATQLKADANENEVALSMGETFDTDNPSENPASSMVDSDIHTASVDAVLGSLNTVNQASMISTMEFASLTQVAAGIIIGQQSENSLPDGFVTQSPNVSDPSQATGKVELTNANTDTSVAKTSIQTGSAGSENVQDGEGQVTNIFVGKDGKDGADGKDGTDGLNGKDGQDGINGKNGTDGEDGTSGRDGEDGKDGVNGKDGSDGEDGADGKDGANGQDGTDGKNGINGLNGTNGNDGAKGETGTTGENGTDGADGKDGLIHLVLDDVILTNETITNLIKEKSIDTVSTKNGLVVLTLTGEELVEVMNTLSTIDEFADLFNKTTEKYTEKFPDAGDKDDTDENSEEEGSDENNSNDEEDSSEEESDSNEETDKETNQSDDIITLNASGGTAKGEGGNDTFIAGAGKNVIDGGSGNDTVDYSKSTEYVEVELDTERAINGYAQEDTLTSIENIIGSEFADILGGDAGDNILMGGKGDDYLYGLAGNDIFEGGEGEDYIDGGEGELDTAIYHNSNAGVTINLETFEAKGGHAEGDYLEGIESVTGSSYDDHIVGDGNDNRLGGRHGADKLFGGDGNDTLLGGGGKDILNGGDGIDTADYTASIAGVQVNLSDGTAKGGEAEGDTLTSIENLAGSSLDDIFFGNDEANRLTGRNGDDTLDGGKGNDVVIGGNGDDTMTGGDGDDVFIFAGNTGNDTITDFEAGEGRTDRIWLQNDEFTSFEEVQQAMNETDEGTTLSIEHGEILFQGVQASEFVADDFILA